MRKVILAMLLMSCSAFAQFGSGTAKRIIQGTPKPATCAVGDVWTDTTASPAVTYGCQVANVWTAISTLANIQAQSATCVDDTGAADAYVATISPAITAYAKYQFFCFKASAANLTTTPTLNVNGKGAKTITKNGGAVLAANDIKTGQIVDVEYDGTNFQMQSTLGNAGAGGGAPTGAAGGDLGSTYPNPTVGQAHWTQKALVFGGSPYTVLATDSSVNCDATSGNVVINLPASAGAGKDYFFVKIDSSANSCTVNRNGADTIEGSASVALIAQYDSLLIRDASVGSWLKVSPKIPGSAGQIIYNTNGSNFGAISDSVSDSSRDVSGGTPSVAIGVTRTYSAGSATTGTMHIFQPDVIYTGSAKENTMSGIYGTMTFSGTGGCSHCLNFTSRIKYGGTGGTTDELDAYYGDIVTTGSPTDTITQATIFNAIPGGPTSGGSAGTNTWSDFAGFRYVPATVSGGSVITVEKGAVLGVRGSSLGALNPTFHGLNVGNCTDGSVYVAAVFCTQRVDFQTPILQSNITMAAASTAPLTVSQLYAFKQSNLLADASTVFNITSLLTHSNGGTGTSIGIDSTVDNGGNSTATKMSALRARCQDTGSGNTVTKCIGVEVQSANSAGNTITNTSGIEVATQVSGTNTNPAIDVNLPAAASANEFGVVSTPISLLKGNKVQLTADWTCGTAGTVGDCSAAQIVGSGGGVPLTFTLPKAVQNYHMHCEGVVGQATAATANSWNWITATTGATNVTASYNMNTAATAMTGGATTDTGATTTTVVIGPAWTLGGTGTKMPFHVDVMLEGAAAAGTVLSLQLVAPTAADVVTIYRGATCTIE